MFCWNERWKPLMSDTIAITVATPMTMPSSASAERMRFAASARRAIVNVSVTRNPSFMASLVAERLDRVEAGGAGRRVGAEEHPDRGAHEYAQDHGGDTQRRGQRAERADEERERPAEEDAEQAAGQRQRRGLDEELGEDVAPPGAERLADADLAGALGHRHQHDVHDDAAADE